MAGKGRGWHGDSRGHGLARKGISVNPKGRIKPKGNALTQLKKDGSDKFKIISSKWKKGKWNAITFKRGKNELYSVMKIHNGLVHITYIETNPKGKGMGTAFMKHMRSYADSTNRSIIITHQINPDFFDKFSWLERITKKSSLYEGKQENTEEMNNFMKQLEVGTLVEMDEHEVNKKGGKKIALDHIVKEDPMYYSKLFKAFPNEHPELRKKLAKGIPKTKMYNGKEFRRHSYYASRTIADVITARLKRSGFKVRETITGNGIIVLYKYRGDN